MLFKFRKVILPLFIFFFFFCKLHDETSMHLFYDCLIVKKIWNQLKSILSSNLNFLISAPQSTIGFWDLVANEHLFFNHLLLIFKMYSYSARATVFFNLCNLLIYIKGIKDTKKKTVRMMQKGENSIRNGKMF